MSWNASSTLMVTAAVAAAEAQRLLQEEEEMTQYSDSDLSGDWEFKIVRATTGIFRKPDEFATLLEEEAKFGWRLLEKLDDGRVRFKRHVRDRARDRRNASDQDPYRSIYGRSQAKQIGLVMLGVFGFMFIIITAVIVVFALVVF
jgi:hypothetical protein